MSTASKLTLLGTTLGTAGIVAFVHWAQQSEKAVRLQLWRPHRISTLPITNPSSPSMRNSPNTRGRILTSTFSKGNARRSGPRHGTTTNQKGTTTRFWRTTCDGRRVQEITNRFAYWSGSSGCQSNRWEELNIAGGQTLNHLHSLGRGRRISITDWAYPELWMGLSKTSPPSRHMDIRLWQPASDHQFIKQHPRPEDKAESQTQVSPTTSPNKGTPR